MKFTKIYFMDNKKIQFSLKTKTTVFEALEQKKLLLDPTNFIENKSSFDGF